MTRTLKSDKKGTRKHMMTTNAIASNPVREGRSARQILEDKIHLGRSSALALIERINTEAPLDTIAKGGAFRFGTAPTEMQVLDKQGRPTGESQVALRIQYGENTAAIHDHALSQLATRVGVPGAYAQELAAGAAWQRRLLAGVMNESFHKGEPNTRYLVRNVKGTVRGVLSDKFRRLDNRPLVEAFDLECQKAGAVLVDGSSSDTRVRLKALVPTIYEPIPGEALAFGVEWGNSDYGNGTHVLRAFMLRVWCLNGATMEDMLRQVHLGRGISDDEILSQRTYELDTKTSMSALRDVVRATLMPAKIEAMCAGIRNAHENKVEWKNVQGSLAKKLLKAELKAAEDAFESPDVYNLPAGNTMWRVSNAVSWIAQQKDIDADRRLDLQRLAGELVDGRTDRVVRS